MDKIDITKLPEVLGQYKDALDGVDELLKLDGKTLREANKETGNQYFYDEKRVELEILAKHMEMHSNAVRGRLFRAYTESYNRELSDRQKDKYIDNEQDYLNAYQIYLEVKELLEKYRSVVDSFKTRSFALNNITKATVASVEETVI